MRCFRFALGITPNPSEMYMCNANSSTYISIWIFDSENLGSSLISMHTLDVYFLGDMNILIVMFPIQSQLRCQPPTRPKNAWWNIGFMLIAHALDHGSPNLACHRC